MTRATASTPSKIVVAAYLAEEVNVPARGRRPKCASPGRRRKAHVDGGFSHIGERRRSAGSADRRSAAADDPKVRSIVHRGKVKEILRASKAVSFRDQQLVIEHPRTWNRVPDHGSKDKALQP